MGNPLNEGEVATELPVQEASSKEKCRGTVKWFDDSKGFGFIEQANGPDVFAHYKQIQSSGYKTLEDGQKVEFDLTQGNKGLQAENIRLVR